MQPTSMGSEQRANHNLRASKRMQRASMGSEQQGNHNFHALKRTRMSHIQQMHDDEDDENARNNDDPAFINEGTSINVIPQIGMPFNGGVMRARCRDLIGHLKLMYTLEHTVIKWNQDLKVTLWGTLANELDIDMIASLLPPVVIVLTSTEVRHFENSHKHWHEYVHFYQSSHS